MDIKRLVAAALASIAAVAVSSAAAVLLQAGYLVDAAVDAAAALALFLFAWRWFRHGNPLTRVRESRSERHQHSRDCFVDGDARAHYLDVGKDVSMPRVAALLEYPRSMPLSVTELNAWLVAESARDRGGDQPEVDFADIRHWGDERGQVDAEAQAIAEALGIRERVRIVYTDEAPRAGDSPIPGGWDPYERHVIISEPTWNAAPGWKRLDTVAHEVMHASQTITRPNWEPRWLEMAALGVRVREAQARTEDWLRRTWAYRTHPLEAEAIAFGHDHRDQHRAVR